MRAASHTRPAVRTTARVQTLGRQSRATCASTRVGTRQVLRLPPAPGTPRRLRDMPTRRGALAVSAVSVSVLAAAVVALLVAVVDSHLTAAEPELVVGPSPATKRRLDAAPSLKATYRAFPGLRNQHVSTIAPTFLRSPHARVHYFREVLDMPNKGHVTLDWQHSRGESRSSAAALPEGTPLLLLLSGIAGGSGDPYVQHLVADATDAGFKVVCMNARGCANSPVTSPQFYSASWTQDVRHVVQTLRSRYPAAPFFACGWSLGANILVNYLGEEGLAAQKQQSAPQLLDGAVSLCNPFDLVTCDAALEATALGRVYSRSMGASLRRVFAPHEALFRGLDHIDVAGTSAAQTVRQFDEAMTRRTFGFPSVDAYYQSSGSKDRLPHVAIPLLCVQAADDPIAVDEAIPRAAAAANPHVALVVTPSGGHLGWQAANGSPFGSPWPYDGVLQWLTALTQEVVQARASEAKGGEASLRQRQMQL